MFLLFLIWSISYFRFCWDAACTTNLSSNWTAGQRSYFIRGYLWNKTSWANNFEIISKRQVWQKKVRILSSADELFSPSPLTLLWNVIMTFFEEHYWEPETGKFNACLVKFSLPQWHVCLPKTTKSIGGYYLLFSSFRTIFYSWLFLSPKDVSAFIFVTKSNKLRRRFMGQLDW